MVLLALVRPSAVSVGHLQLRRPFPTFRGTYDPARRWASRGPGIGHPRRWDRSSVSARCDGVGDELWEDHEVPRSTRDGVPLALWAAGMLGLLFAGARLALFLAYGEMLLWCGPTIVAALAIAIGLTGLTTAWWSPIARLVTRGREPRGFDSSPTWLFILGVVAAAPAVTYVGAAMWTEAAFGGRAWEPELASFRPFIPVAAIGILLVLAVAWRVCFLPFRHAWPRWIPLPVVILGFAIAVKVLPERVMSFDPLFHALPGAVAIAWAIAIGLASPQRLSLTPTLNSWPDPLRWFMPPPAIQPD